MKRTRTGRYRISIAPYILCVAFFLSLTLAAPTAFAGALTVHVGPPGIGSGGANPLSIPPVDILEYEVEYITSHDFETSLSVSPGIFFGQRTRILGGSAYVGLGGGIVIDTNGAGPGAYSSIGYNTSGSFIQFNMEVKQAIGIDSKSHKLISPYALRIGATFVL